jgi:hypothetical protein
VRLDAPISHHIFLLVLIDCHSRLPCKLGCLLFIGSGGSCGNSTLVPVVITVCSVAKCTRVGVPYYFGSGHSQHARVTRGIVLYCTDGNTGTTSSSTCTCTKSFCQRKHLFVLVQLCIQQGHCGKYERCTCYVRTSMQCYSMVPTFMLEQKLIAFL